MLSGEGLRISNRALQTEVREGTRFAFRQRVVEGRLGVGHSPGRIMQAQTKAAISIVRARKATTATLLKTRSASHSIGFSEEH